MNKEKDFIKKLNNMLEGHEFGFDESAWREAEALLAKERRQRRAAWLSVIGVLFLGGTLFFFVTRPYGVENSATAESVSKKVTKTYSPANAARTAAEPVPQSKPINPETIAAQNKPVMKVTKISKEPRSETKADVNQGENTNEVPELIVKQEASHQLSMVRVSGEPAKVSSESGKNPESPIAINTIQEEPVTKDPDNDGTSTNPVSAPVPVNNNQEKEGEKNIEVIKKTMAPEVVQVKEAPAETAPSTETTSPGSDITPVTTEPADQVSAADAGPVDSNLVRQFGMKKTLLDVEGGISYMPGWQNEGSRDGKGINPLVGMNAYWYNGSKLFVSAGLHYNETGNFSKTTLTFKQTSYRFGEESKVAEFTPRSARYITAPLRLHYELCQRATIGAGVNVSYLLTVVSDVTTYDYIKGEKLNSSTSSEYGYTKGFAPFDLQLSVFFRKNIMHRVWVKAEGFYGLTDTRDNTFFNSNVVERNVGLRLTLSYDLIKK